jgi:hypothetical protein
MVLLVVVYVHHLATFKEAVTTQHFKGDKYLLVNPDKLVCRVLTVQVLGSSITLPAHS